MTIDRFGRHIHTHTIKIHLRRDDIITDFFKHPKVAEVIHKLIQRKPARRQQPTTKRRILKLNSDGTLFPGRLYRLQVNGSWAGGIYSEFEGNVVKIVFSNDTTQICIANTIFVAQLAILRKQKRCKWKYTSKNMSTIKREVVNELNPQEGINPQEDDFLDAEQLLKACKIYFKSIWLK
ncbi:hypothetical protein QE152_g9406 [Popillia japonica]|uniref:Site-specific DNA endonuclease n=1 Tax=Popillia japonica TaxID=7064 RepID=A0AAW1LYN8_POPJA